MLFTVAGGFPVAAGFTVTVAELDWVLSWVEVAVTVTEVLLETDGAVNKPEELTLPVLADHVTAELKLPVPDTVAEQLLVWFEVTVAGEQLTLTEVMLEEFTLLLPLKLPPPPPPPQATIRNTLPITRTNPSLCTMSPCLVDSASVYAWR